jgi:hypothetical protein
MVPPSKEEVTGINQTLSSFPTTKSSSLEEIIPPQSIEVSFSHIQLYADRIGDIDDYKELEESLNTFGLHSGNRDLILNDIHEIRKIWQTLYPSSTNQREFVSQNRDVIKQLLVGFGFRVTGYRFPDKQNQSNTRSVLVTSRDPNGVQIIVTAIDEDADTKADDYHHFDAGMP